MVFARELLTHRGLLEINQDPLAAGARRVASFGPALTEGQDVWWRPLSDGSFAMAVVNRHDSEDSLVGFMWSTAFLGLWTPGSPHDRSGPAVRRVVDVWTGDELVADAVQTRAGAEAGVDARSLALHIGPHATAVLRVWPVSAPMSTF